MVGKVHVQKKKRLQQVLRGSANAVYTMVILSISSRFTLSKQLTS